MFKKILTLSLSLVVTGCNHASDDEVISKAKTSISEELMKSYKPNECMRWQTIENAGLARKGIAIAECDNQINPSLGLKFSDLKVYHHKDEDSVCGVVSGFTDISKIGAKFVYTTYQDEVTFLYSKYPLFSSTKSKLSENALQIIRTQYQISRNLYCK